MYIEQKRAIEHYQKSKQRMVGTLSLTIIILLSVAALSSQRTTSGGALLPNANAVEDPCANSLKISKITASASSTRSSYNAIDNNSNTRWTSYGKGSWIKPEFGEQQSTTVCYIEIAWYKGNGRVYDFSVSVSDDGSLWTNVYSGKSSGKTTSFERYDFTDINARWVKITVNGNQWNLYNEITELRVYGHDATSTPTPASIPSYRAMVLPYISVTSQKDVYSKLKQYDMVVLRVAAGTTPSTTYLDLVRQLPGQIKGLEFRSIPEIQNFLDKGNKDGITFVGYVPEPEHGTPVSEMNDIVGSVAKASQIIHKAGLMFELVPRLQSNIDHAADFAPYVDYYTIMGQSYQDKGISSFKSFENSIANKVKIANPGIKLMFAEMSTERNPSPGLTLQQTFQQCESAVIDSNTVNGASIWYNTSTQLQEVKTFLDWFNAKYRQ